MVLVLIQYGQSLVECGIRALSPIMRPTMLFFSAGTAPASTVYSTPRPGVGVNAKRGLQVVLRGANPQEIKSPLLPQGASPVIIAARVLKHGPFRAARTAGALRACCDSATGEAIRTWFIIL